MINSKIFISGTLDREPKINEDGSVDLILTNVVEENAPKILREKGESIFLVKVSKAKWKYIRKSIKKDKAVFSVIGGVKTLVNKKGMPFLYVYANDIIVKKEPNIKGFKAIEKIANNSNNSTIPWFKQVEDDDFIQLEPSDVELVEDDHVNAQFKWIDFGSLSKREDLYIAVKETNDGKYRLISGFKNFIAGKVFNRKYKAYITDLERFDFIKEFEITERLKKDIK